MKSKMSGWSTRIVIMSAPLRPACPMVPVVVERSSMNETDPELTIAELLTGVPRRLLAPVEDPLYRVLSYLEEVTVQQRRPPGLARSEHYPSARHELVIVKEPVELLGPLLPLLVVDLHGRELARHPLPELLRQRLHLLPRLVPERVLLVEDPRPQLVPAESLERLLWKDDLHLVALRLHHCS